jgi:hypothetical protein
MADVIYFVALPFVAGVDGVPPASPWSASILRPVVVRAEALLSTAGHVDAIAFSRTGDPAGDFSDATVIRKFGDVPDDLSAL